MALRDGGLPFGDWNDVLGLLQHAWSVADEERRNRLLPNDVPAICRTLWKSDVLQFLHWVIKSAPAPSVVMAVDVEEQEDRLKTEVISVAHCDFLNETDEQRIAALVRSAARELRTCPTIRR